MTAQKLNKGWEVIKGIMIATSSAVLIWIATSFYAFLGEWHSVIYINAQQSIDITTLKQNYGNLNDKHNDLDKRVTTLEAILPTELKFKHK